MVASALVILLAACSGGSSSTPSREIGASAEEVDGSRTDIRAPANQSGVASEEGSGRSKIVKFTVPTIT